MPFGSIGVRSAPYRKRFRSSFGLGALNCSVLPFYGQGLVSPECWCMAVGKTLCDWMNGEGTYAAAVMMNAPDVAYPPPPLPAHVPAVDAGTSTVPAPYSVSEFEGAVTDALRQQQAQETFNLRDFFGGIAANVQKAGAPDGQPTNWKLWAGIGAAVFGVVLLSGRGRRR